MEQAEESLAFRLSTRWWELRERISRDEQPRWHHFRRALARNGREEIRLAVDKARTVPLPGDREIMHLLPQEFILDDQAGVQDPMGMMATRLEVRVHIVTARFVTRRRIW